MAGAAVIPDRRPFLLVSPSAFYLTRGDGSERSNGVPAPTASLKRATAENPRIGIEIVKAIEIREVHALPASVDEAVQQFFVELTSLEKIASAAAAVLAKPNSARDLTQIRAQGPGNSITVERLGDQ